MQRIFGWLASPSPTTVGLSMAQLLQQLREHLASMEPIGYFTFAVNLIVLLFSGFFARRYGQIKDPDRTQARLRILHGFNFIVFATFLLAVIFKAPIPRITEFSESCLVILCAYLFIHLIEAALLRHFGRERTIEGITRWIETYTSKTLELVAYTNHPPHHRRPACQHLGFRRCPQDHRSHRLPSPLRFHHQGLLARRLPQRPHHHQQG